MTEEEFSFLQVSPFINGKNYNKKEITYQQTHISYLIFTNETVFKIKKTIKLEFLDFSTLENRKKACTQEVLLNRRTAPDVYEGIYEVRETAEQITIGGSQGTLIDFAVRMRRVDAVLEMDKLITENLLTPTHIAQLAHTVAQLHTQTFAVQKLWRIQELKETFNDIMNWEHGVRSHLKPEYVQLLQRICKRSDQFLDENIDLLNLRSKQGLVKDVHGDLHSRNVFMTKPPIIFDCIEFDDNLRQIDLLNEIAFLMMDLEYYGSVDFSELFYEKYISNMKKLGIDKIENKNLLLYFKMYRAAIRAKIALVGLNSPMGNDQLSKIKDEAISYLKLADYYRGSLQ